MGYPVALKMISPRLVHKTEAGAVVLDLKDERVKACSRKDEN